MRMSNHLDPRPPSDTPNWGESARKNGRIFDVPVAGLADISFSEAKQMFREDVYLQTTIGIGDRLSNDLLGIYGGSIQHDTIIVVPVFVQEESLIWIKRSLDRQSNQDFIVVYYVNASEKDIDKEDFWKRLEIIRRELSGKRSIVVAHLYPDRANMGIVRSDMLNAIINSVHPSIGDPLIIGLDADTLFLGRQFIKAQKAIFYRNDDISYIKSEIRHVRKWQYPSIVHITELLRRSRGWGHSVRFPTMSGCASSFRLRDYLLCGWYHRGLINRTISKVGSDYELWYSMCILRASQRGWKPVDTIVWTNPRRLLKDIIEDAAVRWSARRRTDGSLVFINNHYGLDVLRVRSEVMDCVIRGNTSDDEVAEIENYFESFFPLEDLLWRQLFIKQWDRDYEKSAYHCTIYQGKFRLVRKID